MSSSDANDDSDAKRKYVAPDHGTSFVPGAGPEDFAPKSLDHFKRGYEERASQRDKEFYSMKLQQDRKEDYIGRNKRNYVEDPWGYRERSLTVQGLNIGEAMDRLMQSRDIMRDMDRFLERYPEAFETGKAMTALISAAARQRKVELAYRLWSWMDHVRLDKNTFHYNSMISVTEKDRKFRDALAFLQEMKERGVPRNEVTYSSAISACEKCGQWRTALDLLDEMEKEHIQRTAIAYNAAISACEKGMVPQKACEVFQRMKRERIQPSVVSYSALISAAEKGGQWKLALEILEEMKQAGFVGNVVAYSAAISALAKGQQWEKALYLFREIQAAGCQPSIVTYNATMTALEKGMQWERALDLFDEMKRKNLPITVVSYGSAISACDKGLQYRQCLEYLDEMTDIGIQKNVIIFGAAMSCMEKCCRADIAFQLMDRMKIEGITPNVHIYNSVISACARSNLWEKGYELFKEMDDVGVKRDVVTYNAVLDAVASQIRLGRMLFEQGVQRGFYARVSRLGEQWFELDLHFLSLGGGEIALGWWFEECLVPYLVNTEKLKNVKSISIVTGYGKTRTRGRRQGDDGMRKRCKAMLRFMNITELRQPNAGRIHVDKEALIEEVNRNGGRVKFDLDGYIGWKEHETTANSVPDVEQKIRPRFRAVHPGTGRPPFIRVETENTSPEYRITATGGSEVAKYNAAQESHSGEKTRTEYDSRGRSHEHSSERTHHNGPESRYYPASGGDERGHFRPKDDFGETKPQRNDRRSSDRAQDTHAVRQQPYGRPEDHGRYGHGHALELEKPNRHEFKRRNSSFGDDHGHYGPPRSHHANDTRIGGFDMEARPRSTDDSNRLSGKARYQDRNNHDPSYDRRSDDPQGFGSTRDSQGARQIEPLFPKRSDQNRASVLSRGDSGGNHLEEGRGYTTRKRGYEGVGQPASLEQDKRGYSLGDRSQRQRRS